MQYFQILSCSDTLGTCCTDYGLVNLLAIIRSFLDILQIIVPIVLIIMVTIQFIQMMISPDDKKSTKKLLNKFIAALLFFFTPFIVNLMINLMPEKFSVSACWDIAKTSKELLDSKESTYISVSKKTAKKFSPNADAYELGDKVDSTGVGQGSATGQAIVAYALSFVGQNYVWGGSWNGELPYTGTDCSGFVQGVFAHHGISLGRDTYSQWADTSSYITIDESDIKAGDLVMYDGHVAILTGNGNQVVHAQSTATGIVTSDDFHTCSGHAILGIMRINGVN